ncbi:MAG: hypothetical protein ACO3CD_04965 [Candidatus Nanopelagicaceae bacterium]
MKEPFIIESTDFVGVIMDPESEDFIPVLVGSADFFEFLEEQGYEDTMTSQELIFEIREYMRTECEKI